MKKIHKSAIVITVLTLSSIAFAKQTKGEVKREVEKEAATATAKIKSSCGCSVPVGVTFGDFEKMKTNAHDDEAKPRYWKESFIGDIKGASSAAETLCKDAALKKKFCAVKKITVIGKGISETDFKYSNSAVEIYTSEQMQSGASLITDRMKEALDQ